MKIKQAVIPAAGLGSRFLPVTKSCPKELLPLVDKPCLQHVIDEAVKAGVEEFIIVNSSHKKMIEDYFKPNDHLDHWLQERGKTQMYDLIKDIETKASFRFVYQEEPLGLGHAVLCARELIQDDYFFVLLPDDIIDCEVPVCTQIIEAFEAQHSPIVSVMEVAWDQVHRYGIVKAEPLSDSVGLIKDIVEKPSREDAPSNLAVIGRYLLPKEIFSYIENTQPGAGGEIQLTDSLQMLADDQKFCSFQFKGERFDTGTPQGLLKASISLSLKQEDFRQEMKGLIKILADVL